MDRNVFVCLPTREERGRGESFNEIQGGKKAGSRSPPRHPLPAPPQTSRWKPGKRDSTPVNSWGPQGPGQELPATAESGRCGDTPSTLPQTWERRPCSATCSPGARRETLPYTSSLTGSLQERWVGPFPAQEPELRGLARRSVARGLPRSGRGPRAAERARLLPALRSSGVRGARSPVRRARLPRCGSRGAAVLASLSR